MASQSVELRWIQEGPLPGEVRRWFDAVCRQRYQKHEHRVDVYSAMFDCHSLTLKYRSKEQLELKVLASVLGVIELSTAHPDGASGVVQRWTKWPIEGGASTVEALDHGWVQIEKDRVSLLFDMSVLPVSEMPVDPGAFSSISKGFMVELAEIRGLGKLAWSLAVETFPWSGDDPGRLRLWGQRVLASLPLSLTRAQSLSYADWLR